ncbi:MAG: hypothetical protein GY822_06040 [Deltaproteobacteria bacterium]|nr:hypothetical protein [Deltaproteobacteria bacterium]
MAANENPDANDAKKADAKKAAEDAWEALKRGGSSSPASNATPDATNQDAAKPVNSMREEYEAHHDNDPLHDDWDEIRAEHQQATHEKDAGVAAEVQKLMMLSGILAMTFTMLAFVLGKLGFGFMQPFAPGFAIGSALATVNLGIMARATFGLFNGEQAAAGIAFLISISMLLGGAIWVAIAHTPWLFGYCAGMALPAISGVWYAKRSVQTLL